MVMEKPVPSNCYIRLHKTICHRGMIDTINRKAAEWGCTPQDACYRIFYEGVQREIKHGLEIEAIKKFK